MKQAVAVLVFLAACASRPVGSSVSVVSSEGPSFSLDGHNIWVAGDHGSIRHSSDGGETFDAQTSGVSTALHGVSFASAVHGVVVGEGGVILSTEDGGAQWHPIVIEGVSSSLHAVALSRSWGLGVAVGDAGTLLVSHDGGRHFERIAAPTDEALVRVSLEEDSDTIAIVGASGATFLVTLP